MTKSIVKKSPYSIKLLSLAVVAALSGMSSFSVNSAGDDDELLMFVNLAQPNSATTAIKPAAPRPVVAPVSKPAPVTVVTPVSKPAPVTVATPVSKPAPVTVAAPPSVTRATPAPVSPPRATVPATLETPPAKTKRPKPAANWKLKPANPSNSEGFFNRPTAPVISTAPPVTTSTTTVEPKPAVQPPAAQTSMFHPVLQGSVQTPEAAVKRQESVQQSGSGASYFRQVSPQGEPTLTPMPSVPREVAAPRKHVANAPSEAEIKMLFADAVRQSIRISPRINSSRSQVEAAESSVDEAKGQRWPQVDLTSNSKSLYFGSGTRNGGNKSDIPAVGVNVATTLYDFGQNSNTIKTREEQAKAAAVGVAAEEENTAWELSKAMIELNKQRLTIALSEDYVARMKELTAMLSGIVAVDKGRNSELTQAKGRLLSAQSSLDAAVSKARDTEIVIYRLLGESQIALPAAAQWNMSLPNLNAQLARLDLHPTILKAKADAQASLTEAAALRASGLPSLNWVVSKNTGEDEYGRTQAFQTGLQVSWGLFRGGSNTAAERAALARAEANRHLVEEQHRDLEQRVRAANQDAGSMLERADLYQNLKVESDRIRLAFFEQWYHLGKRTLLDVLSAESDYYNNRVSEVNSRFDGYAAIMRSYASSGQLIDWLNSSGR